MKIEIINFVIECFKYMRELIYEVYSYIKKKFYYVNLKELRDCEIDIINKFYNTKLNEYTLDVVPIAENDDNYPVILKLIKKNVLNGMDDSEKIDNYTGFGVNYSLTNRAYNKLNKRKEKMKRGE